MFVLILIAFILSYILQISLVYHINLVLEMPKLIKCILVIPMIGLVMIVSIVILGLIYSIFQE